VVAELVAQQNSPDADTARKFGLRLRTSQTLDFCCTVCEPVYNFTTPHPKENVSTTSRQTELLYVACNSVSGSGNEEDTIAKPWAFKFKRVKHEQEHVISG
jgi:hypothetical protein